MVQYKLVTQCETFFDAILHFIHLIEIYDPKVLNLQKIQDRKKIFD